MRRLSAANCPTTTFIAYMKTRVILSNILYPLCTLLALIAVWWVASLSIGIPLFFPTPSAVLAELGGLLVSDSFYLAIGGTLSRTIISFILAFAIGVCAAALAGLFKPMHRILRPIVVILRAIPTMSVILISVLWLDNFWSPVLIGFLIVFPLVYTGMYEAIGEVDRELIEMARLYKVSRKDTLTKLLIPSVTPTVLTVAKSSVSLNVKVIIAAEVIALTARSIGAQMQLSKITIDIPVLFAWTVAAILLAFLLEFAVSLVQFTVRRHYDKA